METVDWACPHAFRAAIQAAQAQAQNGKPKGVRLIMAAGAGERVLDALSAPESLSAPDEVVACAATVEERSLLELRVAALEGLPPDQAWALLGLGRHPIAAVLAARMSEEAAAFWRRRTYVLGDLYRHGRSGWLMWLADLAARLAGVDWSDWPSSRWRANAALWAAFNASPISPALWLRAPADDPDWDWHRYAMARLEAAGFGTERRRACQWEVVLRGRYDPDNAPPHLAPENLAPENRALENMDRLRVVPASLKSALRRAHQASFDVVVMGDEAESLVPQVARVLAPGGVCLVWSVHETPRAMIEAMTRSGLDDARKLPNESPGLFASHWLFSRSKPTHAKTN